MRNFGAIFPNRDPAASAGEVLVVVGRHGSADRVSEILTAINGATVLRHSPSAASSA